MARLYTTYYHETNRPRRSELDLCLAVNAESFDRLHVLSEGVERDGWRVAETRQTYADLMRWAQEAQEDDIVVIANCDILIPPNSIEQMEEHLTRDDAWCLTRWEVSGGAKLWDVMYSQDVWCFRGPPRVCGDFHFGVPGCDNRIAHELRMCGYAVANPSKSVKTLHVHGSGRRTITNSKRHRVPAPYLYITPHALGERPVLERQG